MSALWLRGSNADNAVRRALRDVLGHDHHRWTDRARISVGRFAGPVFWPAWYVVPQWKRDQWHKICCELDPEDCETCSRYYGL